MKLFMQGMRRSGTTVVFDALSQDDRLDLYYEPFSAGRVGALGGGSGLQPVDLMEKIRETRASFIEANGLDLDPNYFNWGAPREPELELETELPPVCREYIAAMLGRSQHTVFKFTRMYCKVRELWRLAEDGCFALLVRHPQEVVASYMYGRDQKRREKFADREAFFTFRSTANPWNSRRFIECIAAEENRPELLEMPDWMTYLALWKYTFDRPFQDGSRAFGDRFTIVRYEDMTTGPEEVLARLYRMMGLEPNSTSVTWARAKLRTSEKACYPEDERWTAAYEQLGLNESLADAGYGPLRPSSTAAPGTARG
jgi:hypothetical protein